MIYTHNQYRITLPDGTIYNARFYDEGEYKFYVVQSIGTPRKHRFLPIGDDLKWREVSRFYTTEKREAWVMWNQALAWVDSHKDKGDK